MYMCAYLCVYKSAINDNDDTRGERKELELFCYKALALPVMSDSVIRKWTWISCKCIFYLAVNVYCKL